MSRYEGPPRASTRYQRSAGNRVDVSRGVTEEARERRSFDMGSGREGEGAG